MIQRRCTMEKVKKGMWLHSMPRDEEGCRKVAENLAEAGFDLLVACVKFMDGKVEYPSRVAPVREGFESFDALETMTKMCHDRDLKIHAWCCVFIEGADSPVGREEKLRARTQEGGVVNVHGNDEWVWVCPRQEEVRNYELSVFTEILDNYEVDGVHMDYIRYNARDACFCERCRREFEEAFGEDITHMLDELKYAVYVPALDWRAEPVTQMVRDLHRETEKRGKELSAAVFSPFPTCFGSQGQDWYRWAREGIVDQLFPMNYSPSPIHVRVQSLTHRQIVASPVELWEGLKKPSWADTAHYRKLIEEALGAEPEGFVVFQYSAMNDDDWKMLKQF